MVLLLQKSISPKGLSQKKRDLKKVSLLLYGCEPLIGQYNHFIIVHLNGPSGDLKNPFPVYL